MAAKKQKKPYLPDPKRVTAVIEVPSPTGDEKPQQILETDIRPYEESKKPRRRKR